MPFNIQKKHIVDLIVICNKKRWTRFFSKQDPGWNVVLAAVLKILSEGLF